MPGPADPPRARPVAPLEIREATHDEEPWERTRAADRERALALLDPEDPAAQYRSTVLGTRG